MLELSTGAITDPIGPARAKYSENRDLDRDAIAVGKFMQASDRLNAGNHDDLQEATQLRPALSTPAKLRDCPGRRHNLGSTTLHNSGELHGIRCLDLFHRLLDHPGRVGGRNGGARL